MTFVAGKTRSSRLSPADDSSVQKWLEMKEHALEIWLRYFAKMVNIDTHEEAEIVHQYTVHMYL